jgi:hypothetical protein
MYPVGWKRGRATRRTGDEVREEDWELQSERLAESNGDDRRPST